MDVFCLGLFLCDLMSGNSALTILRPDAAISLCPPVYRESSFSFG